MRKKWLLVLLAVVALAAVAVWVNMARDKGLPQGFAGANGRLELQRLDVATLYPGRVEAVQVDEGDEVSEGMVLAELSSAQSTSQLAAAKAAKQRALQAQTRAQAQIEAHQQERKVAQMELDNTRELKQEALVSAAELTRRQAARDGAAAAVTAAAAAKAEAAAAVAQAQAQMDAAAAANDDMLIRAPQAGRVAYRLVEPGNVLAAGSKVVSLHNPAHVSMTLFLPTDSIGRIRLGDEARIVLDGIDAVWPAKVQSIADEAQFTPKYVETANEREKLMYRVALRIPDEVALAHKGLLKGGLTGNGYVRLDTQLNWPAPWQVRLPQPKAQPQEAH